MELSIESALQAALGLGLLNVWLLRAPRSTGFRGGEARSLREEFAAYGLPVWSFAVIGFLKVGAACVLLAGLWLPALVMPAALLVAALMVGALAMHLKVGDSPVKFLPALVMLVMSGALTLLDRV